MRGGPRNLPAFTHDELLHALKQMGPGKAADGTGVVAEMLKVKCDELHDLSFEMFSDIFRGDRRGVLKADPMVRKRVIRHSKKMIDRLPFRQSYIRYSAACFVHV